MDALRKNITSYDVARLAGVSQSAVSRCFKPGASVSKKMKDKVMAAAKELGYAPNAIARSLTTNRSNLVAVLISHETNLFYPEVLSEMSRKLTSYDMNVLFFSISSQDDIEETVSRIWPYRVDGVIAAAELTSEHVKEFQKRQIPLVFYNRYLSGVHSSCVYCDQEDGVTQLLSGLWAAGSRKYAILAGPEYSSVAIDRRDAAILYLDEQKAAKPVILSGDFSYQSGYDGALKLLSSHSKPDAIICANDVTAMGALDAIRMTSDYSVPDDISVVGFDGVGPSEWSSYRLTTIRQPVRRMTDATVSLLIQLINDPGHSYEKRVFTGILQAGQSARLG